MPEPLGKDLDLDVCMMCNTHTDQAGDKETRHSRTGFLIFCNMALIDCQSTGFPRNKEQLRPQSLVPNASLL